MKNQAIQFTTTLAIFLFILACQTKKGPLPELTYTGEEPRVQNPLTPEESQQHIQLPEGFEAELFAAEPDIINPIAFTWDERGRLWVIQSQDYPHGLENDVGGDRITICEDTNRDGKADKFTDFATELSLSTGIVIVKGGAIVAQAPEMVFLEDTDGDDKMDKRTVLFDGFGIWDTHAGPSNLRYGPDNQIWGALGYSGFEGEFQGKTINFTMGVFRFTKDGQSFEPVGRFNNNTWGLGITQDFEIFGSTANNNHCCYVGIPLRHYDYLSKRPSWAINSDFIQGHYEIYSPDSIPLQQVDVRGGYTAAAGANFYTAENYPEEYRNQMYVNEPTGHLVHIAKIVPEGAGYKEEDGGNIFASTDAWTAPVFSETGPDGNLWVADWYNPVIQHNPDKRGMDNQIWNDDKGEGNAHVNPLRDKGHGRIYIIKHKNDRKTPIKALDANKPKALLKGLQSNNMFWRITAQRLIVENDIQSLVPDLIALADKDVSNFSTMHVLWTLDGLDALNDEKPAAYTIIENALSNKSETVKRAGLSLLPDTEEGSQLLISSGLLNSDNLNIRLAAVLRATELPETEELHQALREMAQEEVNKKDKWLNAAIKVYFREQNYEELEAKSVDILVPSGEDTPTKWRYIESEPPSDWHSIDFDDSNWQTGKSGFGTPNKSKNLRTAWTSKDIWLRKTITLNETIEEPVIKVVHDEAYEVYVNGQLLFKEEGWRPDYKYLRLDADAGKLFKKGKNLIAVHGHNDYGDQSIDVGFGKVASFKADKVLQLNTVSQKMAYDKTVLHAIAGQNLEIVLNNVDEMPHNLVLIEKGSLKAFGKLVDKFLISPDAAKKEYVPDSRYVLGATKMLNPGDQGKIQLRLPEQPGTYPFICTFPGHWRMMQGVLIVSPPGTYISADSNAIKIAVMGGGGSHEFEKYFGVADGKVMSQGGKNTVNYTESSAQLGDWLSESDILIISNNKPFGPATKEAIFSKVEAGMPMLIYHPSTWYNWEDWPEYNRQLVGGGSRSHEPLQEFEVRVVKPAHPIMKGVPSRFRITDELYRWEKDAEGTEIEVLAVGRGLESGEEYPVVWIVKHDKTRIVGNTLGHDGDAHNLPAYKTILNNSLNWVKVGVQNREMQ